MKEIIQKIKDWFNRDNKDFEAFLKQLERSAEANWKSNFAPRDFKDFKTYKEFFIQSHLAGTCLFRRF